MDMRSLNSSLPPSTPKKPAAHPPESILQAFKSAALSVTTLYKTAAADQARAHSEGYQDALEHLNGFLDKENIGLGDGEGWTVRRWAMERLQGTSAAPGDSEEDVEDQRKQSPREESPRRHTSPSEPPEAVPAATTTSSTLDVPQLADFTFRSVHPYPDTRETDASPADLPRSVRVELHTRSQPRSLPRSHSHRTTRSSASGLGPGAGVKRKAPFMEFFDVGPSGGPWRDGSNGGSKRGRLT